MGWVVPPTASRLQVAAKLDALERSGRGLIAFNRHGNLATATFRSKYLVYFLSLLFFILNVYIMYCCAAYATYAPKIEVGSFEYSNQTMACSQQENKMTGRQASRPLLDTSLLKDMLDALAQDIGHVIKVLIIPHQR